MEDFVIGGNSNVTMVWNMTTEGCTLKRKGRNLQLTNPDGKVLNMKVETSTSFDAELVPAERKHDFEGENTGVYWLRIRYELPAHCTNRIKVTLTPKQ